MIDPGFSPTIILHRYSDAAHTYVSRGKYRYSRSVGVVFKFFSVVGDTAG